MTISVFHTGLSSPLMITLIILYFLCASISTFDTRIIQAKKYGYLHPDSGTTPNWSGFFAIGMWILFIAVFLLNYKIAIILFIIKFILKVIPVLENIGAVLMIPVVGRNAISMVNVVGREQNRAARELKRMEKEWKSKSKVAQDD